MSVLCLACVFILLRQATCAQGALYCMSFYCGYLFAGFYWVFNVVDVFIPQQSWRMFCVIFVLGCVLIAA